MNSLTQNFFEKLLVGNTHWIDVRAPNEYADGAIPGAKNLPLLDNDERHEIGLIYKTEGQIAAIERGNQLVAGAIREQRLRDWMQEYSKFPGQTFIYCFRGGLRSQTVQKWLLEKNIDCPIVVGGYKALRSFLLESFTEKLSRMEFLVVSGPTGSGKTSYLHKSGQPFIDLEALANHRGSVFGSMPTPQPNQVNFENALAICLLKLQHEKRPILIESESRMIGRCNVPDELMARIKNSPKITLEVSLEERVETIFNDYILQSSLGIENDVTKFDEFRRAIHAISKKLGGLRSQEILENLNSAQNIFQLGLGLDSNREWIRKLLVWYYDPLYSRSFI